MLELAAHYEKTAKSFCSFLDIGLEYEDMSY